MFGLFKRTEREVEFGEIADYMKSRNASRIKDAKSRAESIVEDIRADFSSVEVLLEKLKEKKLQHDVNSREPTTFERFDRYSEVMKDRFCERSLEIIESVMNSNYGGFSGISGFLSASSQALSSIGEISIKEFKHLRAFEQEIRCVASGLRHLEEKVKINIESMNDIDVLREMGELEAKIRGVIEAESNLDSIQGNVSSMDENMISIRSEIETREKSLVEFQPLIEELKAKQNEGTAVEDEISAIKMKISTEFGGIERVLKKFVRCTMDNRKSDIATEYMKSPFHAFLADKDNEIKDVLFDIKDGDMNLNLSKKEKIRVTRLLNDMYKTVSLKEDFAAAAEKLRGVVSEIEMKEKKLVEREALLKIIGSLKNEAETLQRKKEFLAEKLGSANETLVTKRQDMESFLKGIAKEVVRIRF